MSSSSAPVRRPIGVTILAVLAGIAAVFAFIHALQFLGIIPFFIGPISLRTANFWYALMWGLMVWVWVWLVQMLWRVDPQAWIFLVVITIFNLVIDFMVVLGEATWTDVSASVIVNSLILIYCMLPGVKNAFNVR